LIEKSLTTPLVKWMKVFNCMYVGDPVRRALTLVGGPSQKSMSRRPTAAGCGRGPAQCDTGAGQPQQRQQLW